MTPATPRVVDPIALARRHLLASTRYHQSLRGTPERRIAGEILDAHDEVLDALQVLLAAIERAERLERESGIPDGMPEGRTA